MDHRGVRSYWLEVGLFFIFISLLLLKINGGLPHTSYVLLDCPSYGSSCVFNFNDSFIFLNPGESILVSDGFVFSNRYLFILVFSSGFFGFGIALIYMSLLRKVYI